MRRRKKEEEEKVNVWTDILIILVIERICMERFRGTGFGYFVILAVVGLLLLRTHFAFMQEWVRGGLSIVGALLFLIDALYSKDPWLAARFPLLFGTMVAVYFISRYVLRLLGFK